MDLIIKNIRLEPAEGGYLIRYSCYVESGDNYDGLKHVGDKQAVVEDGKDAIAKVDELYEHSSPKPKPYKETGK